MFSTFINELKVVILCVPALTNSDRMNAIIMGSGGIQVICVIHLKKIYYHKMKVHGENIQALNSVVISYYVNLMICRY